jgi:uncharacterized repeat protein (TIGR04138 family)
VSTFRIMPPTNKQLSRKTLHEVVEQTRPYPVEAFEFIKDGLNYTISIIHGDEGARRTPGVSQHVTGQQLCLGLREYALMQWGMLASVVLRRWNITRTVDFGRIVFAMVDNGLMSKTDDDSIDDFRNVYDFAAAFDSGCRINLR